MSQETMPIVDPSLMCDQSLRYYDDVCTSTSPDLTCPLCGRQVEAEFMSSLPSFAQAPYGRTSGWVYSYHDRLPCLADSPWIASGEADA